MIQRAKRHLGAPSATIPTPRAYVIVALEPNDSGYQVMDINSGVPLPAAARALALAQQEILERIVAEKG
jgi:hypothetical protein